MMVFLSKASAASSRESSIAETNQGVKDVEIVLSQNPNHVATMGDTPEEIAVSSEG